MQKLKLFLTIFLSTLALNLFAATEATFNPPEGWRLAETQILPKFVKLMVVGKGKFEMPPSMNLGYEEFQGSIKEYIKIIKNINTSQGDRFNDLGTIQTAAGPARLTQIDMRTEWGVLRQMHLVYKDQEHQIIYILSAAALKEEFAQFYPVFFKSLQSFNLLKNP